MTSPSPQAGKTPPQPADWSALLAEAVEKPGLIADAYRRFWNYSAGNQLLALSQCHLRGLPPGPLHTFNGWKELGRSVKKGEKALTLCVPINVKGRKPEESDAEGPGKDKPQTFTRFVYRPRWFVLPQTEGEPYEPQDLPGWGEEAALADLNVSRVPFDLLDGNCQGFARGRSVSVSPIAFLPHRTLFHELAHVVLGHTAESDLSDDERTPRDVREVEAESVALICCESLGLDGAPFSRGYIQHYLRSETIPERSAYRVFRAADAVLRAGRGESGKGGTPCA